MKVKNETKNATLMKKIGKKKFLIDILKTHFSENFEILLAIFYLFFTCVL